MAQPLPENWKCLPMKDRVEVYFNASRTDQLRMLEGGSPEQAAALLRATRKASADFARSIGAEEV